MQYAMHSVLRVCLILTLAGYGSYAQAPEPPTWLILPGVTSASIAVVPEGWQLVSSSGLSWPHGKQAIVTFWRKGNIHRRCLDYFDADMQQTGGLCYEAKAKR